MRQAKRAGNLGLAEIREFSRALSASDNSRAEEFLARALDVRLPTATLSAGVVRFSVGDAPLVAKSRVLRFLRLSLSLFLKVT